MQLRFHTSFCSPNPYHDELFAVAAQCVGPDFHPLVRGRGHLQLGPALLEGGHGLDLLVDDRNLKSNVGSCFVG